MAISGSSSILIVDDDRGGREALEALLLTQGYTLVLAASGAEALRKLSEMSVDLVLLDIMMPGMDGYEVCRRIRNNPAVADIPVLMLTALTDYRSRLAGFEAGADDYIAKPYDSMELFARVRTITRLNRYRRQVAERVKFQQLFDLSPNGRLIIDAAGVIQLSNRKFLELVEGDEPAEVEGLELAKWISEGRRVEFKAALANFSSQPSLPIHIETELSSKTGHVMPVEAHFGRVEYEGQVMIQGIIHDLSKVQGLSVALERQQTLLQTLVDSLPDLVYCKDSDSHFSLANRALAAFFGFNSPSELIGKTDQDLKSPELAARFFADDQRLMEAGKTVLGQEEPLIDPKGNWLVFSTSRVPLRNPQGKVNGLLGISRDITRLKKVQRDLETIDSSRKGLADKIQSLEDLLVEKEKEKNQSLAWIGTWFSRVGLEIDQDTRMLEALSESQASQVARIQANAGFLRKSAQDLLEFSRLNLDDASPAQAPFALEECIRSAVDLVSGEAAQKELSISLQLNPNLPAQVVGDYDSLVRVLTRLLKNAIRVTPAGEVGLQVDLENYTPASSAEAIFLHMAILDGSPSVSLADLQDPFAGDDSAASLPLDLAICSRLMIRSGGGLWVERRPDASQGMAVHFTCRYTQPVPLKLPLKMENHG